MLIFGKKLLAYCKKQAQEGKPLSTTIYDEDNRMTNMSIYDEAFEGWCPNKKCDTAIDAVNLIHSFKYLLCPGQPDIDALGDYYNDYCDALCRCLAKLDYEHITYKRYGIIDYDFYECCRKEGVIYNRWYYVTAVSGELVSFLISQGLYYQSDVLKYVASEIKRTSKYCKPSVALKINGVDALLIPEYEAEEDLRVVRNRIKYDKFITSSVFLSQILPKLPKDVADAFLKRDKSMCGTTRLSMYVKAIVDQYAGDVPRNLYCIVEAGLKIPEKSLSKAKGKKKHLKDKSKDVTLAHIKEYFPKFNLL